MTADPGYSTRSGRGAYLQGTSLNTENDDSREDVISVDVLPPHSAMQRTVPHLHAGNGRLDARKASTLYGISLAALSRALGRSE